MDSGSIPRRTLPSLPVLLASAALVYWCALYVYRLFLHPLSKFPGPKLAAATSWYEAYYEIVLQGQYSRQISKLHDQYGMCVHNVFLLQVGHGFVDTLWLLNLTATRSHHPRHTR